MTDEQILIILFLAESTTAAEAELTARIQARRSGGGWPGGLEEQLRTIQDVGLPWQSKRLGSVNPVAVCLALADLERSGLVECFNPSGRRTVAAKLTEAGWKLYEGWPNE